MIVDDEPATGSSIARILKRDGYETMVAIDGFSAGSLLATFKPMLMTLDLSMPNMNGFEVLKFMAQHSEYQHVKVLVVSALHDELLQKAVAAGAYGYLSKPFTSEQLRQSIAGLL